MGLKTDQQATTALVPNDWNPNVMKARVLQAERESIEAYGFIDPITVRPHPTDEGRFQIIDGEHRWKVASELGIESVPVVVLDLDDNAARKLTIILNETRGRADVVDLGKLLGDLADDMGDTAELLRGLPYSEGELDELIELAGVEFPDYSDGSLDPAPAGDGTTTIQFVVSESVGRLWERVQKQSAKVHGEPDGKGESASAFVFEKVLRDWTKGQKAQ